MTANSMKQAWQMADEVFPTDYVKDERSSANAGYDIYRSTVEGRHMDYICDLGNRLEVNLSNGKVVNIWIEGEKPSRTVYYVTYKSLAQGREFTFWTEDMDNLMEMLNIIKKNPDTKLVSVTTEEC